MVLFLHGASGGWDELAIAVVALAVLWIAVKLAGRKPAQDDDEEDVAPGDLTAASEKEQPDPGQPSPTKPR
jgi:hypothetical protein